MEMGKKKLFLIVPALPNWQNKHENVRTFFICDTNSCGTLRFISIVVACKMTLKNGTKILSYLLAVWNNEICCLIR